MNIFVRRPSLSHYDPYNARKKLRDAITPDEAFKVIFGGFLWGFPVVCLATVCYIYTKNAIW